MPQTARRIVLASRPVGEPKLSDFRLEEFPVPQPGPGELLLRTKWLSLDPYMRGRMSDAPSYAKPVGIDEVMEGGTVGEVAASNNDRYSRATSCSAAPAGRRTRSRRLGLAQARSEASRRSRPRSACSACRA
jgi:NADPH-dependent curcumin reductase CurA